MVVLDYVILGCLALGLILGLWKGFIRQIFAIAGIFLVGLGTSLLSPYPDKWLSGVIQSDTWRHITAIAITFVVLGIIYAIVTKLISKLVNKIPILGWLNRLLGAIFSVAVVYMVFAVVVAIVLRATSGFIANLQTDFLNSWFVNKIYGGLNFDKNFFGNWLVNMFVEKITALLPAA
ncbi:MAG: CvpA family protein [Corallococcus sp.]|nr:CvpA family protein [Corallococcus sp.]MCM1359041.1 CvpA family protein [Corallococcus sp.]MCM1395030.1 CvpA family protein [Corallococcus sp.]